MHTRHCMLETGMTQWHDISLNNIDRSYIRTTWQLHLMLNLEKEFVRLTNRLNSMHKISLCITNQFTWDAYSGMRCKSVTWKISTSNLSSLDLWDFGSKRNSSVNRMHSSTLSGETKSRATLMQDCIMKRTQ